MTKAAATGAGIDEGAPLSPEVVSGEGRSEAVTEENPLMAAMRAKAAVHSGGLVGGVGLKATQAAPARARAAEAGGPRRSREAGGDSIYPVAYLQIRAFVVVFDSVRNCSYARTLSLVR